MRGKSILCLLGGSALAAPLFVLGAAASLGAQGEISEAPSNASADAEPAHELTFRQDIFPILKAKCLRCHNGRKRDGKLDMSTLEAMLKGGNSGPPLVPGNSKKSLMVDMIFFDEMPPKRQQPRVSEAELKRIEAWIDAGAKEGFVVE